MPDTQWYSKNKRKTGFPCLPFYFSPGFWGNCGLPLEAIYPLFWTAFPAQTHSSRHSRSLCRRSCPRRCCEENLRVLSWHCRSQRAVLSWKTLGRHDTGGKFRFSTDIPPLPQLLFFQDKNLIILHKSQCCSIGGYRNIVIQNIETVRVIFPNTALAIEPHQDMQLIP